MLFVDTWVGSLVGYWFGLYSSSCLCFCVCLLVRLFFHLMVSGFCAFPRLFAALLVRGGSALRVPPAETRLTVYRRLDVELTKAGDAALKSEIYYV